MLPRRSPRPRIRDPRLDGAEVFHSRAAAGGKVDFVIEAGGRLLPIEVNATVCPRLRDATPRRSFRAEYAKSSRVRRRRNSGA